MNERQQRFIDLLNQIFELDKSDLDFGIYRILNIRRDEITKYFSEKLPEKITEILKPFASADNAEIKAHMHAIETQFGGAEQIAQLPDTMPIVKEYNDLKLQLERGADLSALESDVYGALYSFFSRYYDEGDFISKRRYKEGVYAIPYEGEEVKLYWANQDQYYIKTSENFKDYTFLAGDYTINFHLVDATTEQNNNKEAEDKKRKFMLFEEDETTYPGVKTFEVDNKNVIIRFRFDIPEDPKHNFAESNLSSIKLWLANQPDTQLMAELLRNVSNNPRKALSLLEKHLQGYVAKNTFDYFIHKDLGGFLRRELDFFIKNEIMHLDDIETEKAERVETYLAKVRAVKKVGNEIIRFLAQMEDFQKKLWLKKKFVVDTQWCITLDKIDESFYEEIRNNKAQVEEWKQMYAIHELQTDLEHTELFTEVPSMLFLKQNQNLIVDTRHFTNDFKLRLVESIDNLDEQTNGVMFNADNFQALGLMQEKYKSRINTSYADPPYNTSASEIMYKNGYRDSSWLCLMEDRIKQAKKLLTETGIQCTTIDDVEQSRLSILLGQIYETMPYVVSIRIKPSGRPIPKGFAISHEYALFSKNDDDTSISRLGRNDEQLARYREVDELGHYFWEMLRKAGSNSFKEDRPSMCYPIYWNTKDNSFRLPKMTYDEKIEEYEILEKTLSDEIAVFPTKDDGALGCWYFGIENIKNHLKSLKAEKQENGLIFLYYRRRPNEGVQPTTFWDDSKYSATEHGTALLKKIFGKQEVFAYPKSIYAVEDSLRVSRTYPNSIVLDYFAGSATTGHAVINLNREDNGNRKYILVEMGTYFETVTLPRIKKVVYSKEWKDGNPIQRTSGVSQIVKYMRLESYEDALSNIELKKNDGIRNLFGEDYYINYILDLEAKDSLLNIGAFRTPFNYQMKITEKNESKQRFVDVVETFNYLIGLNVTSQGRISTYNAQPAVQPEYEGAVDLRTAPNGEYSFQQIEGKLRDGKRALIIWRTIGDDLLASNAALDAYFQKYRINPQDREYDVIYVNGDNNIENLRLDNEDWKVLRIEEVFNKKMFE